ncbi:MAG: hypothetical protein O6952_00025, partial [Planctomycetota bacterium]|nr:hypothetical protein [Planctomycetota bacterium]
MRSAMSLDYLRAEGSTDAERNIQIRPLDPGFTRSGKPPQGARSRGNGQLMHSHAIGDGSRRDARDM